MSPGRRGAATVREVDLYPVVKSFLEGEGYEVKGEIGGCDILAIRGDEPPLVVELKLRFTLGLVLQAVDRLRVSDSVYLAVPAPALRQRGIGPLCRRLGVGLLAVHPLRSTVDVLVEPGPYRQRHDRRRSIRLSAEHARRKGDPTPGGSTGIPIETAYRQEARRIAVLLAAGPASVATIRSRADAPTAGRILARDPYGWFERVERGIYRLRAPLPAELDGVPSPEASAAEAGPRLVDR